MASDGHAANVLLVEGEDDKHVVRHLCDKLAPDLSFCCSVTDGKDALLAAIPVVLKQNWRRAVGVLMDANDDIDGRWQAIGDQLRDTAITLVPQPQPGGVVLPGDPNIHLRPSFGVWLMPDNAQAGELEDFVIQLLPRDDPVWPLAQRFIDDIPRAHREFQPQKERRAKASRLASHSPGAHEDGRCDWRGVAGRNRSRRQSAWRLADGTVWRNRVPAESSLFRPRKSLKKNEFFLNGHGG